MYAEIVAAVQSTKALAELLKAANGLSNYVELLTAVNTVQEKLSQALISNLESTEKQASLSERVRELEKQIAEVENWEHQMDRYVLFEFPTRALAYATKPGMEQGEPLHYLCTTCKDKRQITILQPHGRFLRCQICKTDIETKHYEPTEVNNDNGSWMAR
jgi:hypothetical protein